MTSPIGISSGQQESPNIHTRVTPTIFEVTVLPPDFPDGYLWTINVEYRGSNLWAIVHHSSNVYGKTGMWDYEPIPSERTDEWLEKYRWSLHDALEIAQKIAPDLKFRGMSPEDALRDAEELGKEF
jgi:hypothetical protein